MGTKDDKVADSGEVSKTFLVVYPIIGAGTLLILFFAANLYGELSVDLEESNEKVTTAFFERQKQTKLYSELLADNPVIQRGLSFSNTGMLLRYTEPLLKKLGVDRITTYTPAGLTLSQAHQPEQFPAPSASIAAQFQSSLLGQTVTSIVNTGTEYVLQTAAPVFHETDSGKITGVVCVGYVLGPAFAVRLAQRTTKDISLYLGEDTVYPGDNLKTIREIVANKKNRVYLSRFQDFGFIEVTTDHSGPFGLIVGVDHTDEKFTLFGLGLCLPLLFSFGFLSRSLESQKQTRLRAQRALEEKREHAETLQIEVARKTKELRQRSEELEEANQKLQDLTITDSLTGLRNRRFLVNYIGSELADAKRRHFSALSGQEEDLNRYVVFAMVDLDHFKSINDTYGHAAGDQILVETATILRSACRESDQVIRWGGEEFVVVAPKSNLASSHLLAKRIVEAFRAHPFEIGQEEPLAVTCSVGFGCYPMLKGGGENLTWEDVVGIADQALYAAKKSGRNMWVGLQESPLDSRPEFLERLSDGISDMVDSHGVKVLSSLEDPGKLRWEE